MRSVDFLQIPIGRDGLRPGPAERFSHVILPIIVAAGEKSNPKCRKNAIKEMFSCICPMEKPTFPWGVAGVLCNSNG